MRNSIFHSQFVEKTQFIFSIYTDVAQRWSDLVKKIYIILVMQKFTFRLGIVQSRAPHMWYTPLKCSLSCLQLPELVKFPLRRSEFCNTQVKQREWEHPPQRRCRSPSLSTKPIENKVDRRGEYLSHTVSTGQTAAQPHGWIYHWTHKNWLKNLILKYP